MTAVRHANRSKVRTILLVVLGSVLSVTGLGGCAAPPDPWAGKPTPRVVASFTPIACFARNVMGNDGSLQILTTNSPHEYQPAAREALRLRSANVFLLNGLGADDQARQLVNNSGNSGLTVAALGEAVTNRLKAFPDDPHVWLGPPQAEEMVSALREVLKKADPAHAVGYEQRANNYITKLKKLHEDGKAQLAGASSRKIVAFHDSLRYFAAAFDLDIVGKLREWNEVEADPRSLRALVDECKSQHVRVIVTEPGYPTEKAERLLKAIGGGDAKLVEVDSLETATAADLENPTYYERTLRANLAHLAEALK